MDDAAYAGRDLEALLDLPHYYDWIASHFAPYARGVGIEYGAGLGTVSQHLLRTADALTLVEPSTPLATRLRARFADCSRVSIAESTLEAHLAAAAPASADFIALVNVLEHIEDDGWALSAIRHALRPGGHLLLFVPALPFLFSAFDEAIGHHRRYTLRGLRTAVANAGLGVVTATYLDMLGILPWYVVHTRLGRTELSATMARLYDRLAVPLGRWAEAHVRPPIGKNVLLVATRF